MFAETLRPLTESTPVQTLKHILDAAFFHNPEPQPVSTWRMIINPPMPYFITLFCQASRILSFLILLPVFLVAALDFAGYAVFRTLGLHRQRVRIQRQSKSGVPVPAGRSASTKRKTRVYQRDNGRPTENSNYPSIVKAPLLSPGTYDAETLLRQRARSMSSASAEAEAAWVASGGEKARLSTLNSPKNNDHDSDDDDNDDNGSADYFGRASRVGVDGALGLADTDVDESGTESGRDSPVQSKKRGVRGLNFTPVSPSAETISSSSKAATGDDEGTSSSSNMSSSWVGVDEVESPEKGSAAAAAAIDPKVAAEAAGLESESNVWKNTASS